MGDMSSSSAPVALTLLNNNLLLITPVEEAFLNNTRHFTNAQKRYIGCRLKKKLRLLEQQLNSCNVALAERSGCNAINVTEKYVERDVAPSNFYAPWSGRE
jgi:hypothetical protein